VGGPELEGLTNGPVPDDHAAIRLNIKPAMLSVGQLKGFGPDIDLRPTLD
jgi:hypothetical protein